MRRTVWMALVMTGIALAGSAPAAAETESADLGFQSWGIRVGVADDPDQVVGGVQLDFGELVERLRLRPDFELGLGDDHTILNGTVPVHYLFPTSGEASPYLGGGVTLAWIDRDRNVGQGDDSELEVALELIGGVEWTARGGDRLGIELSVHAGDVYDLQLMGTWTFR